MSSSIRQIFDPERPSWSDWNNYLKQYIPKLPLENKQDVAPEYGYIFDKLRQKYGIFISIIPNVDANFNDSGKIVFRYIGKLVNLESTNKIHKELTVTGLSYSSIAKKLTSVAVDLIKTGEIIDPEAFLEINPDLIWIEDESEENVRIVSNTIWNVS